MPDLLDHSFLQNKFGPQTASDSDLLADWGMLRRTFHLSCDDLFAKWEVYDMQAGNSNSLSRNSLQGLRESLQRTLEKSVLTPDTGISKKRQFTPKSSVGRTAGFESPLSGILGSRKRYSASPALMESPTKSQRVSFSGSPVHLDTPHAKPPAGATPLKSSIKADRPASRDLATRSAKGRVVEVLNDQLPEIEILDTSTSPDFRVNVDMKKFNYRSMYQKLSDMAEYLDEQIETFIASIQEAYGLGPMDFGNPSTISQSEIVAVGRVIPESPTEDKLSTIHLQSGRRFGAGSRVELRLPKDLDTHFFPGQIVAVRGSNASGMYFSVSEILDIPTLPPAASSKDSLINYSTKKAPNGLKVMTAAGPYTYQTDLEFTPLEYLISLINDHVKPSVVILLGPFIDVTHPLVAMGDFTVLDSRTNTPLKNATLDDLFKREISDRLQLINSDVTVVLIPHVRDAASNHPAYPQPALNKRSLGLPRNVHCQPNPATFSVNEVVISASSQDVVFEMSRTAAYNVKHPKVAEIMSGVLAQRTLYPLFPGATDTVKIPTGKGDETLELVTSSMLDVPYMGLAEFNKALPDIVILPSRTKPLSQIANNVVMVNPGLASRWKSPGEYAVFSIHPYTEDLETQQVEDDENDNDYTSNEVYKRIRVEIIKV